MLAVGKKIFRLLHETQKELNFNEDKVCFFFNSNYVTL